MKEETKTSWEHFYTNIYLQWRGKLCGTENWVYLYGQQGIEKLVQCIRNSYVVFWVGKWISLLFGKAWDGGVHLSWRPGGKNEIEEDVEGGSTGGEKKRDNWVEVSSSFGFRQFHSEGVAGGPCLSCRYLGGGVTKQPFPREVKNMSIADGG